MDDILVYPANRYQHKENLKTVLKILGEKKLLANLRKCSFWLEKVSCLGHVVSRDGNAGEPTKIEAIIEWERPTRVRLIHSFLGFDGY